MANNITMLAKHAVSAKMAQCFLTVNGNRYNFMNAKNVELKLTKNKAKVAILGKPLSGHKTTGMEGTGTATFYYNTSIFRRAMLEFKKTGEDFYFTMQITNEDPSSAAGRQTIQVFNCNLDDMILAKFDAESEDPLDEEVNFTFDDWEMPESFTLLDGMEA